jgi:hypothetical protein
MGGARPERFGSYLGPGKARQGKARQGKARQGKGQTVTFVLAIGSVRQACRLQTTFRTKNEAFGYFYKHRTEFGAGRACQSCTWRHRGWRD